MRVAFSKLPHAARPRIGPPSANHGPFTTKPSIYGICYSQGNPALTTLNTWINPLKPTNDDYNSVCSQLVGCGFDFHPALGMQFAHFRNSIEGVACAQTSVPFRNAFKRSCLQKGVFTYNISLSFPAALTISLSRCHKGKKTMIKARNKELRD